MDQIYSIIGKTLVFIISFLMCSVVAAWLYYKIKETFPYDVVRFYLGKRYETQFLRELYRQFKIIRKSGIGLTIFKHRLRNIKRSKKDGLKSNISRFSND
jgi:hypothetical protein